MSNKPQDYHTDIQKPLGYQEAYQQVQTLIIFFNHIGSFGRVLLAKQKKTGEYFAMKRLKKADIIKLRQVDHVISENTILADIEHPFLVSINRVIVF